MNRPAGSEVDAIRFTAEPYSISSWTILRLPPSASAKLPSRGQAMVEGTINGIPIQTPLEPDGKGSHWFRLDEVLGQEWVARLAGEATVDVHVVSEWPEPDIPPDLEQALAIHPRARAVWGEVTPMARWEWVRWVRSTGNRETRKKRIRVACSKLESGKRRPCCWNRNASTEPSVSRNGVLLDRTDRASG